MSGVPGGVWAGRLARRAGPRRPDGRQASGATRRRQDEARAGTATKREAMARASLARTLRVSSGGGDRAPLVVERSRRGRLAGAAIPVAGVADVAFLAVQVGVDPGALGGLDVLGDAMGAVPVAGGVVPQRTDQRRRVSGSGVPRSTAARRSSKVMSHSCTSPTRIVAGSSERERAAGSMNGGPRAPARILRCPRQVCRCAALAALATARSLARAGRRGGPGHRRRRRRGQPPAHRPERLRRRPRRHGGADRPERAAEPLRRQQHDPHQLAAERRQPRRRLVLREHRRPRARRRARSATPSSPTPGPPARRRC